MDETTPPPVPPQPAIPPNKPLSSAAGAGLGFLLFIVSTAVCYLFPPAFLVGFVAAVVCLFKKGYRSIFVGHIITVGVLLLVAIAYCSIYPPRFD